MDSIDLLLDSEFGQMMQKRLPDVGVARFNEDHQRLLGIILAADMKLERMVLEGDAPEDWTRLTEIITALTGYAATHFEAEEELMARHAYPETEAHRSEHLDLVSQIEAFRDRIVQQDKTAAPEMRQWLLEWFFNHINKVDLAYKGFFEERGEH